MASFGFYSDEQMTVPFNGSELSFVIGENQERQGVFYIGSPNDTVKLQTELNAGVDNIQISPQFNLSRIQRETEYALLNCNDYLLNDFVYRLKTAGTTAATAPTFPQSIGSTVSDGSAVWQCVSEAQKVSDIRLALSEAGLDTALAGAAVQLGNTIVGGTAIAVYYRFTNSIQNVFNSFNCPQLCVAINDCIESEL